MTLKDNAYSNEFSESANIIDRVRHICFDSICALIGQESHVTFHARARETGNCEWQLIPFFLLSMLRDFSNFNELIYKNALPSAS